MIEVPLTDRQMIELAVRALGRFTRPIVYDECPEDGFPFPYVKVDKRTYWDPLGNSRDAFELSIMRRIEVHPLPDTVMAVIPGRFFTEVYRNHKNDHLAAARRAIVRAAAELGQRKA